jgi:hypothetical protein
MSRRRIKRSLQHLRQFRRWRPKYQLLFLVTFSLLGLIRLGLWRSSFRSLVDWVDRISFALPRQLQRFSIQELIWAVEKSTQFTPGGAMCLARALTAKILMKQQGYDAELKIGVTKDPSGAFKAHAWIEYQGEVTIGDLPDLVSFQALPSMEGKQA